MCSVLEDRVRDGSRGRQDVAAGDVTDRKKDLAVSDAAGLKREEGKRIADKRRRRTDQDTIADFRIRIGKSPRVRGVRGNQTRVNRARSGQRILPSALERGEPVKDTADLLK